MIREYKGIRPQIHDSAFVADTAQVIGKVYLSKNVSIWDNTVLRGDICEIRVGENSNIQELSSVHNSEGLPVVLGKNVTVGHRAILHSCTVGDNSLIGMGAILLDGVQIGNNCIVGAGAVVTPNTVIPDNSLVLGMPAKVVKPLSPQQIEANIKNALEYVRLIGDYKNPNP